MSRTAGKTKPPTSALPIWAQTDVVPLATYPPRAFPLDSIDLSSQAVEKFLGCRPATIASFAPSELDETWWSVVDTNFGLAPVFRDETPQERFTLVARIEFEYDQMPRKVEKGSAVIEMCAVLELSRRRDKTTLSCQWHLKGLTQTQSKVFESARSIAEFTNDSLVLVLSELVKAQELASKAARLAKRPRPWYLPEPSPGESAPASNLYLLPSSTTPTQNEENSRPQTSTRRSPRPLPGALPPGTATLADRVFWSRPRNDRHHRLDEPVVRRAWPSMQDYNEALQSPQFALNDGFLADGMIETNSLGLPRATSGGFATVYKLLHVSGAWAIRCFNTPVRDHAVRYGAIERQVRAFNLDEYFAGFTFMEEGIRVNGELFPVVAMEWIDALPLNSFIEKSLGCPQTLLRLRQELLILFTRLHNAGTSHGDLQHGNILVKDCKPVLVDYDSMFVKSLSGLPSMELGHRNYQHPARDRHHFDENLDNFSSFVIDVSILALISEPELWREFHTGENLIFSHKDFEDPAESRLFDRLHENSNPEVVFLCEKLEEFLQCDPLSVPPRKSLP